VGRHKRRLTLFGLYVTQQNLKSKPKICTACVAGGTDFGGDRFLATLMVKPNFLQKNKIAMPFCELKTKPSYGF
jgi:hypothetical protein